ncbi:hypothetical protein GQX73_g7742 [Xylaria multiplex]|uniref:Uncharacterized protein n=1 Tax=Xylaria multiplex TaxID=323545 RepID=A0A7C8INR7_9PEZI|nr:hypothetical protein GQX73_g7742 [Xylaria multiplex]
MCTGMGLVAETANAAVPAVTIWATCLGDIAEDKALILTTNNADFAGMIIGTASALDAKDGPQTRTGEADSYIADDIFDTIIAKPRSLPVGRELAPSLYTYLSVEARVGDNPELTTVCMDTGCLTILADRAWVARMAPTAPIDEDAKLVVRGVVSPDGISDDVILLDVIPLDVISLDGVLADGEYNNYLTMTNGLKPNLLLGTDFLYEHMVNIDYPSQTVVLGSCDDVSLGMTTFRKKNPIRRRAVAAVTTVVLPHTMAAIPVCYTDLPATDDQGSACDYLFKPQYEGTMLAIMSASTGKVVLFFNDMDALI